MCDCTLCDLRYCAIPTKEFSQLYLSINAITCWNSKHIMLGFPLIMHKELLEWNLEVSSPSKLLLGILRVKQSLIRELWPIVSPLESRQLGHAKIIPATPSHWRDLREYHSYCRRPIPPWHAEYQVASTCYSVKNSWDSKAERMPNWHIMETVRWYNRIQTIT